VEIGESREVAVEDGREGSKGRVRHGRRRAREFLLLARAWPGPAHLKVAAT
jgi:hypothetical protein